MNSFRWHFSIGLSLVFPSLLSGFVVGVIEEGRRPYVVTIPSEETLGLGVGVGGPATVAAVPMDPRVPKIRIKTRQIGQVKKGVGLSLFSVNQEDVALWLGLGLFSQCTY